MKLEELLNNRSVTISVTIDELKEFADYIISTTNTETETGIKDEWIKDLGLSKMAEDRLMYNGIHRLSELLELKERELLKFRNTGAKTVSEIKKMLKVRGLVLAQDKYK